MNKQRRNAEKPFIILAEDDRYLAKVLSKKLLREGVEVDVASDGREAIEKVRKRTPDLLLLDIVMPNKNGFEVLEELALGKAKQPTNVFMLTNLGQTSDMEKAKALGASDYIIKSDISIKELAEKILKFLNDRTNT